MKIVVMEPLGISQEKLALLAQPFIQAGNEFVAYNDRADDVQQLISRIEDADVVIMANQPLPGEAVTACKKLKMLSVAFTGVDHVDLAACKAKDILVCNAAGYSTNAVAELTFGLAISVIRNIVPCDARCRSCGTKDGLVGFELYGKTFGVVGTGAIGSRVAMLAKAFGCRVIASSLTEKQELKDAGVEYVPLTTLLQTADFISLHVPLTESTKNLIDSKAVAMMKPGAVLLNTSRGPVVDSAAVAAALNEDRLAGAGIDVFENEPPIAAEHPLCGAKNAVLTPHVAFASREALEKRAEIVFNNIEKWIAGTPQNLIK
jgi:phosphoglycerate dehydrogenase-like enzyme